MKDSPNRWRRAAWLLFPLYTALLSAAAVECGARWLVDADPAEVVLAQALPRLLNSAVSGGDDTPLGPRLSPDAERTIDWGDLSFTVRTNSLGFRGREPAPRAPGEVRLLFLGDSMVFGHGLEEDDTLPRQVERAAPHVVAYNGAVSGMNTVQELAAARQLLPVLQPDLVILGYFVGNDPLANTLCHLDAGGAVVFADDQVEALRDRLLNHLRPLVASHAFRAVALRYYVPRLRYLWSDTGDVVERSCDLVRRLRDDCAEAGARFAVLLIYPRDGVAGGMASFLSGSRSLGRELGRRLRAMDVAVLDGADILAAADRPDATCYFPRDGHLNAEGTRRLAAAVVERLLPEATPR